METSQFEGKKVALKQTKDGYAMTLAIHPDDIPDELMRDFVGARYMVVMVRLADNEEPLNREEFAGGQMVKLAGMLCRDPAFWEYLSEDGQIFKKSEEEATEWIKSFLEIKSRSELKTNHEAHSTLKVLNSEFKEWKTTRST
jgi:hypothetical protein